MLSKKHRNFKNKIYHSFMLAFTLTLLGTGILVFGLAVPNLYQKNIKYEKELVQQSVYRLEEYLTQINALAIQVSYSSFTRTVLDKQYDGNLAELTEYMEDANSMSLLYQDFLRSFKGIDGIFIFNINGYSYYFSTFNNVDRYFNVQEEDWYDSISTSSDYSQILFTDVRIPSQFVGTRNYYVSMIRNIRTLTHHDVNGQAEILIRPSTFSRFLEASDSPRKMALVDRSGTVIYSNDQYETGEQFDRKAFQSLTENDRNSYRRHALSSLYSLCHSEYSGWYIIEETPPGLLLDDISTISFLFVAFALSSLLGVAVWGRRISAWATQPITVLMEGVSRIEHADFDTLIELDSTDEFGHLASAVNDMAQKLKQYILQIQQAEDEKRQAEIIALQAQINPHFTLNTINTIKHLALLQNSMNIVTMLDDFAILLTAAFRFPNELITVKEELNRIQAFIRIETINSLGKIKISLNCEEDAMDCMTIGLILQPIVENAIFHGIKSKMEGHQMISGNITISASTNDNCLFFHIIDDGVGMSEEQIQKAFSSQNASSIGIKNVNTRIKLRFGKDYGLSITSTPSQGCDVFLLLPKIKKGT